MTPAELGYIERRPGSGIWYLPGRATTSYAPRTCENLECGREFMARRHSHLGQDQKYCSNACWGDAQQTPGRDYERNHQRVIRVRGSASAQICVDGCGRQAEDWSQIHGTTGEDPSHYERRCKKCHMAYDDGSRPRGEQHGMSRLTEARVRGIRASVDENGNPPPADELAAIHGTTSDYIGKIRRRERWKHVS